mgnify:CR=1 FL=1
MRGAHYSHSQHFYDECDRLGIMSIVEFPAGSYVKTNELYLSRLKERVREEVMQCRNHPTVMLWSIYNELYSVWDCHRGLMGPKDGETVAKLVQAWAKELDPYHATTCAAAYSDRDDINRIADVLGFNAYPGWYHEGGVSGEKSEDMAKIVDAFLASGKRTIVGIGVTANESRLSTTQVIDQINLARGAGFSGASSPLSSTRMPRRARSARNWRCPRWRRSSISSGIPSGS